MSKKPGLLLLAFAGCWTSSQPAVPQPATPDVVVELAAVTLGDDCGDAAELAPPVARTRAPMNPGEPLAGAPMPMPPRPEDICEHCAPYRPHCDQTSMQLSLRAAAGRGSTSVKIKRVELLDKEGNFLANLTSRAPTHWSGESYEHWDQVVAAGQNVSASYLLSTPNWDELTSGRWSAHTKTFQLRVTLAVGDEKRTALKQSITPAMLEPPVPT